MEMCVLVSYVGDVIGWCWVFGIAGFQLPIHR